MDSLKLQAGVNRFPAEQALGSCREIDRAFYDSR